LPLFLLGGIGAAYVTLLSCLIAIFDPQGFSKCAFLIHSAPTLLFLPSFLLAISRRRGTSIPLLGFLPLVSHSQLLSSHN
jgi:hypothetical protein